LVAWYPFCVEELVRFSDVEQAAAGDGPLVWVAQGRGGDRLGPGVRAWRYGSALAVAGPEIARHDRIALKGDPADALALTRCVLEEVGPSYRVFGEGALIDELVRQLPGLEPLHNLVWVEYTSPPGDIFTEVRWLSGGQEQEVAALLDRHFPDSEAQPGLAGVRRWAGAYGEVDGLGRVELLAAVAEAWSGTGCGFLAGGVVHTAARGRGLGRAVYGFAIDSLVRRYGRVGGIVAPDNAASLAAHKRLGTSRRLLRAASIP
jgi:ribosomal protein S18 acetylase RimI-like enzyme